MDIYWQKIKNYDDAVESFSQDNGKTVSRRTGITYYIETTVVDDEPDVNFQRNITDADSVISELVGDLVAADAMVEKTRLERDLYMYSLARIIDMGIINAEQVQSIAEEIGTQLNEKKSGKNIK